MTNKQSKSWQCYICTELLSCRLAHTVTGCSFLSHLLMLDKYDPLTFLKIKNTQKVEQTFCLMKKRSVQPFMCVFILFQTSAVNSVSEFFLHVLEIKKKKSKSTHTHSVKEHVSLGHLAYSSESILHNTHDGSVGLGGDDHPWNSSQVHDLGTGLQ